MVATVETVTTIETLAGRYNRLYRKGIAEGISIVSQLPSVITDDTETVVLVIQGSTGEDYMVQVSKSVTEGPLAVCTCPAGKKPMPCKHLALGMDLLGLLPDISDDEHNAIMARAAINCGDAFERKAPDQLDELIAEVEYLRHTLAETLAKHLDAAVQTIAQVDAKPATKKPRKKKETADAVAA